MTRCDPTIGRRIRDRRKRLGWTQRTLVRKAGYSGHGAALSMVECGEANFSAEKLVRIAEALGCTVEDLTG